MLRSAESMNRREGAVQRMRAVHRMHRWGSLVLLPVALLALAGHALAAIQEAVTVTSADGTQLPAALLRFVLWLLTITIYRIKVLGRDNIPEKGGALFVCNHVSFVDVLLLIGSTDRMIRAIMFKDIYDLPIVKPFASAMPRTLNGLPACGEAFVFSGAYCTPRNPARCGLFGIATNGGSSRGDSISFVTTAP